MVQSIATFAIKNYKFSQISKNSSPSMNIRVSQCFQSLTNNLINRVCSRLNIIKSLRRHFNIGVPFFSCYHPVVILDLDAIVNNLNWPFYLVVCGICFYKLERNFARCNLGRFVDTLLCSSVGENCHIVTPERKDPICDAL